jgi:hypothetical protein
VDHCCTVISGPDGLKTITTYAGDLTRNCPVLERGNARVTTLRSALQWKNYQDKIGFSTEFRG